MLGTTNYCYTQNITALDLMVSEIFLRFPIVSLREMMTPQGVANLDPRSMIGRIYVHCYTQNIKALGLMVKRRFFFIFSYCMTMGDDDPRGVDNLVPRGMIGRIYVEYHLTLLHTKYASFRPCGFREDF